MITARYVVRAYLAAFLAALGAMTALYVVVDFADRAKFYSGNGWLHAVVVLYGCKLALVAYDLAPAAAAFGAAVAMSRLRRTGEVTALFALGRGPMTFVVPIALAALVVGGALSTMDDPFLAPARLKAEEITALRFHRWGEWGAYHFAKRWFRGRDGRVYHFGKPRGTGFSDVTLFDLTPDFRLARRIDADRLTPTGTGAVKLDDVTVRTFAPGAPMRETHEPTRLEPFPDDAGMFHVEPGKPDELLRSHLPEQIALRRRLGLPFAEYQLALHERRAHELVAVPAALLGLALALRRKRRGHLTAAISEGFAVTIGLWALAALSRTLALAGHLPPVLAGWLPFLVASAAALAALRAVVSSRPARA